MALDGTTTVDSHLKNVPGKNVLVLFKSLKTFLKNAFVPVTDDRKRTVSGIYILP